MSDLAPPATGRWTKYRKAAVVRQLRRGEVTREDVLAALGLTDEELDSWMGRYIRHGPEGLALKNVRELP